jgi:hypothetical protein
MEHFKFSCYVVLMTLCYALAALLLPYICFLLLGHMTLAFFYNILRLTPTQLTALFWISAIFWTGLGFWMGWRKGREKYLAKGAQQTSRTLS